jgi:hypothetical protein
MDFNLKGDGEEVERFLLEMIRDWPARYEKAQGVLGTMFMGNAFGLAGPYAFRMTLDMNTPDALFTVDHLYKTDAKWKKAISEFRKHRENVRCRLLKMNTGDQTFRERIHKAAQPSLIYVYTASVKASSDALISSFHRLFTSVTYTSLVQSESEHGFEAWSNIPQLGSLDAMGAVATTFGAGTTQLFAPFRIVDGSLVGAA